MGYIITLFILLSSVVAVGTYIYTHKNLWKMRTEINKLIEKLNELSDKSIMNLDQISNLIEEHSNLLYGEWEKYYIEVRMQTNVNKLIDPVYYINFDNLLNKYTNKKLANAVPSLLTGIGIFGTFLGLVIGLSDLNQMGMSTLKNQIPKLINGMQISFQSSLYAIGWSLAWTTLDKISLNSFEKKIDELIDELHRLLPIRNESNMLEEIVANQKEQIKANKEFITDSLIPEIVNGLQEAVEISISPQINQMNDTVNRLADVSSSKQAEGIDKMVDKFMNTFNDAFDHQFEALKDTLEEVITWQKNTKNEMEELIKTIQENARNQNDLLDSTQSLLTNMQGYVGEFDQLHKELNVNVKSLSQITGQLNTIEDQVNNKLSAMIDEYSRLEKVKEEETERLEKQMKEISNYWDSVSYYFNELNNNLSSSMDQFKDGMYDGLQRTFEVFDKNLSEIAQRLSVTISEIDESIEELPDSMNNLIATIGDFELNNKTMLEKIGSYHLNNNLMLEKIGEVHSAHNEMKEQISVVNEKLDEIKDEKEKENKGFFANFGGN